MSDKKIVIRIGGSLMYREGIELNTPFLEKFKNWYEKNKENYSKIVILVGGGKLSRTLSQQMSEYTDVQHNLHQMNMSATNTNAFVVNALLSDRETKSPSTLGHFFELLVEDNVKTIITGGLKVGWSTDMDGAVAAEVLGIDRVYKLSNIDHVYDSDPAINLKAKPIQSISWEKYMDMFGINSDNPSHTQNAHVPVDAICARFCYKRGVDFFISGGKNIYSADELGSVFESGTHIYSN
ncbi:MAG TPA: hypothetical protein PLX79_02735 [Candidatus Dojkabacteria bacterium]|nr:hypothetical protein [Candidatus Dojkabacteria bacterium]